jgi:hypothetical protein
VVTALAIGAVGGVASAQTLQMQVVATDIKRAGRSSDEQAPALLQVILETPRPAVEGEGWWIPPSPENLVGKIWIKLRPTVPTRLFDQVDECVRMALLTQLRGDRFNLAITAGGFTEREVTWKEAPKLVTIYLPDDGSLVCQVRS